MIPHNIIANELIQGFESIRLLKAMANSGGSRRALKGKIWEKTYKDISNNAIEAKRLRYTSAKKPILCPIPNSNRTIKRNPDLVTYNNMNEPTYISSVKEYGCSTQVCAELVTFQTSTRVFPSIKKCIYFRGHRGGPNNAITDLFCVMGLNNIALLHNFMEVDRDKKNETWLLDYRNQVLQRVEETYNFLYGVME